MEFSAKQIADFLKGEVLGDEEAKVNSFSKIEEGKKGTLSFLSNPKYSKFIYDSEASIILVNKTFEPEHAVKATLIKVDNAYESLAMLFALVEQFTPREIGVATQTHIDPSAQIGDGAYIEPFVSIGKNVVIGKNVNIYAASSIADNVQIGDNVTLYAGVKLYKNTIVGSDCILHAGVVLGSDGFGFAPTDDKSYKKIPQMGNVVIEDNVEIGANTTIDRATLGSTIIRKGVKLDNLIQIAHNVEIGENTVVASQAGISGSTKIGRNCIIAGQVGIAGHLSIAEGTILAAQSGVPNSIKKPNQALMGSPIFGLRDFQRSSIVFKSLPEMQKKIYELERLIKSLSKTD